MIKKLLSLLLCASFAISGATAYAEDEKVIVVKPDTETYFEAEDYAIINSAYEITHDPVAYPGNDSQYLHIPTTVDANLGFWHNGGIDAEHYYNLEVLEDGMYDVWVYLYTRDTGTRALNVNFDGGGFNLREAEYDPPGWRWMLFASKNLKKGRHTMGVLHRHKMTPVDKFIITPQVDFNPYGAPISTPEYLPEEGESKDYYYNLPPINPPANQHPRLLLNEEKIEEIKQNLDHPQNASVYQTVLKRAAIESDGKFPPIVGTAGANISYETVDIALSNAFLYALHKDKAAGQKAVMMTKNMLTTAEGNGKGSDAFTRQGGHMLYVTACVYDWCFDLMTEEERTLWRKYIYRVAVNLEIGYPTHLHTDNFHGHNLEMQIWKDLAAVAIAIYDEDPKMWHHIGGRMFDQMIPIRNMLNESIFFSEGPVYGPMRFTCGLFSEAYLRGMGYKGVFGDQQHSAVYGSLYRRRPDGKFFKTADNGNEDAFGFESGAGGGQYFFIGNWYNDPKLKREYYRQIAYGNTSSVDGLGPGAVIHLILNDVNVPVAPEEEAQLPFTVFSKDGTMVARTSWEEGMDSNAVVVQMNTKEYFYNAHDHRDAGHFDIYYKGNLAIDSGIYESDPFIDDNGTLVSSNLTHGSKHYYGYQSRSIAHNTMLVLDPDESEYDMYNRQYLNDGGQKATEKANTYENTDSMKTGDVLAYDFGPDLHEPEYSYLKGDLKGAYTDKIKAYERSFMFLNFFDETYPAALIVMDNVESKKSEFKKTWLLHSQEKPEIDGNRTTIRRTEFGYNGRLINDTLLPLKADTAVIGGERKEFFYDGVNYHATPKTKTQEAGKWRVEISSTSGKYKDTFLNVMQVSDNSDKIQPLDVELIRDDSKYAGVQIKDKAVFLAKDKKLTIADTKVWANGECDFTYIIDGMRCGQWNAKDSSGKVVASCIVEEGHNVVRFTAPAGEYTLVWQYKSDIAGKDYSMLSNVKKVKTFPHIQVDQIYETFKNTPYDKNGELYIPVEEYLEEVEVKYTKEGSLYTIGEDKISTFDSASGDMRVDDKSSNMNGKMEIIDGVLYVAADEFLTGIGHIFGGYDSIGKVAWISSGIDLIGMQKLENSDDPKRVRIKTATASSHPYSSPYDACDGNLGSYWGGEGDGEWLMFEFEKPSKVECVDIKWHVGNQRVSFFELQVSNDKENWITIYDGQSKQTDALERNMVKTDGSEYKYLRLLGHENSSNAWNSVGEVQIYNSLQ